MIIINKSGYRPTRPPKNLTPPGQRQDANAKYVERRILEAQSEAWDDGYSYGLWDGEDCLKREPNPYAAKLKNLAVSVDDGPFADYNGEGDPFFLEKENPPDDEP